jgi:hypothetical protein
VCSTPAPAGASSTGSVPVGHQVLTSQSASHTAQARAERSGRPFPRITPEEGRVTAPGRLRNIRWQPHDRSDPPRRLPEDRRSRWRTDPWMGALQARVSAGGRARPPGCRRCLSGRVGHPGVAESLRLGNQRAPRRVPLARPRPRTAGDRSPGLAVDADIPVAGVSIRDMSTEYAARELGGAPGRARAGVPR